MTRILALLLLSAAAIAQAQSTDGVRIYRCTDASGKQSLRDTPCPDGQQQQARDMLRPRDAPAAKRPPAPAPVPVQQAAPAPVVFLAPPRPMFECTTHDGKRYTSDNDEGNPRWVPLWTLGYRRFGRPQQLPAPAQPPSPQQRRPAWPVASGGGRWIRDDCAMLPPAETCARLRDRRSEIRTRFFNAMPSERDVLRVEERAINARLDNDCGGR